MPYEYKRKQDCRQKSGDKGTYVTKKQGASSQKCWKSEQAYEDSTTARHSLDEKPSDPGPNPGKSNASKKRKPSSASESPTTNIKSEYLLRAIVKSILLEEQVGGTLEIMPSEIAGMGVFAIADIPAGTNLGTAHIKLPDGGYHVTELGHFHNHSYKPNCINRMEDGVRSLYAAQDIFPYEEITVDYTQQPDLEQPKKDWR